MGLNESVNRLKSLMGLNEDYNYHITRGNTPLDPSKKHVSDTINSMSGRGTGHFGSGTYFSTYKQEDPDLDNNYGQFSNTIKHKSLLQINDKVYRVHMDFYKNLYKVNSENQAEALFKTLKTTNNLFYYFSNIIDDNQTDWTGISDRYLKLRVNYNNLGLKLPNYREFLKMMLEAKKDIKGDANASRASFSTRMMEYNGWNGVNVSGIKGYDNTLHGSVIYDLSKTELEEVPQKKTDPFNKYDNKSDIYGQPLLGDIKTKILSGKQIFDDDVENLNKIPENEQIILMKRYKHYLFDDTYNLLSNSAKNAYNRSLPQKIKAGVMEGRLGDRDMTYLINGSYFNLINDKEIEIKGNTILGYILDRGIYLEQSVKDKLIANMRELDEFEKDYLKYFE